VHRICENIFLCTPDLFMPLRNIVILTSCQLISATGAIVFVTLGGIIGSELTKNPNLATLPISIAILSMAASAIPATLLMKSIGRKHGFSIASISAAAATVCAAIALHMGSFTVFILAGAMFGINMAFTQQYRYAAAESVEPKYSPQAISYVLVGAIGGALAGPELVKYGQYAVSSVQYLGTLMAIGLLYGIQSILFLTLGPLRGEVAEGVVEEPRAVIDIIRQPLFIIAVLGGLAGYGVMTFIMTATPLSMHIHGEFSLVETSKVIRAHVLGMYVPSLFTGHLIKRFGIVRIMSAGAIALVFACFVGLQGQTYMHYWYALVLLGVGWNFLYIGSTTMVTLTYTLSERFQAQAVNEFSVFGTSAAGSLLAGVIIHMQGWYTLILIPLPVLIITLMGLLWVRGDPLIAGFQRHSSQGD